MSAAADPVTTPGSPGADPVPRWVAVHKGASRKWAASSRGEGRDEVLSPGRVAVQGTRSAWKEKRTEAILCTDSRETENGSAVSQGPGDTRWKG